MQCNSTTIVLLYNTDLLKTIFCQKLEQIAVTAVQSVSA